MVALNKDPEIQQALQEEHLRYVSDSTSGFFRQKLGPPAGRAGKKFNYYDLAGKKIKDPKTLARIKDLRIPPAWKNVWVAPEKNGHLQATGLDERGRKQYIYHSDWIKLSQQNKFSKMVDFGLNLPKIRQKIRYDLQSNKIDKRKILATIVWLLEHTFIRIGNEQYEKENHSFGLTTLRSRHVKVRGSQILFQFKGKGGVYHTLEISNPAIAKTIKRCTELPGFELFQFIDEGGGRHVIDSQDVNDFLKDVTQDDFSAKDFRTWGAGNLSTNYFYKLGSPEDKKSLKKNIVETVKKVAQHLNNTVSVCRNYYIHPSIIQTYQTNILVPHFASFNKSKPKKSGLSWDEVALINLLQKYP